MCKDTENDSIHETRTAYVGIQADVVRVQLDIPRDVWNRLARWATEHHIREADAAVQIIEQQVGPSEGTSSTSFYADLIGRHLRGELEPGPHLVDIQVDESIAKAIRLELEKEYGIDDPVELVERMRNRE